MNDDSYVLNYKWAFGLNHRLKCGIQYLTSANRNQVLYASAHTGVIYDYEFNKQYLLRGHCNTITSICKSHDDHWVATADLGKDSLIIVWDTQPSLTLKQEQEYQQQMLRNQKNNQMLINNQENEIKNDSISRESSTDTIDFESLRNKDNNTSHLDIAPEENNNNEEEEEEEKDDDDEDIENEISAINNKIDKDKSTTSGTNESSTSIKPNTTSDVSDLNTPSTNNETSTEDKSDSKTENIVESNVNNDNNNNNNNNNDNNSNNANEDNNNDNKSNSNNNNVDDNNINDTEENKEGESNINQTEDLVEPIDEVDNIFGSKKLDSEEKRGAKLGERTINEIERIDFLPIKTIINPHHNCGVVAMKMSQDSKYLVTLGGDTPQTLCIWNWTTEEKDPLFEFQLSGERQKFVDFNRSNAFEFVTNGDSTIYFYTWDLTDGIKQHKPIVNSKDLINSSVRYTYTIFIPNTQKAISATECGSIILWDNCVLTNLSKKLDNGNKSAIKIMKLHNGPINVIDIINDKYFVTGGEDGFIRIYDFQYRLYIWLEKINGGPILSISFNKNRPGSSIVNSINIPDFMILTKHSKILHIYNGEEEDISKRMANASNSTLYNGSKSNNALNEMLANNEHKIQSDGGNANVNAENQKDSSKNTPNYDIDKFITISKFPKFDVILETQYDKVSAIKCHPLKPEIAISGYSGLIQIYNYLTKELIIQRLFEYEEEKKDEDKTDKEKVVNNLLKKKLFVKKISKIESISYSNKGSWIAVGFTNGTIRIVDSVKLEDILTTPDKTLQICSAQKPITQFAWSLDDSILAAADDDNAVSIIVREEINYSKKNVNPDFKPVEIHGKCLSIFKDMMETNNNSKNYYMGYDTNKYEWNFIGRYKSHWKKIIKILFMPSNPPRLLSLGKDRMIVEYDLENSSFINGIKIKTKKQLEQTSVPSALCLNISRTEYNNSEDFFIIANEDYKLKLFNSNTFLCRKTVMSPNYGSPINQICILPTQNTHNRYLVYSTENSIIGILKVPISGNPYDNLGVMAHSGEIVGVCCSKDGHYVFSADSYDTSVNMWSVNVEVLEAQSAIGGKGNEPFINLLDPNGRDSEIYKEMEDYFYYAQLRTQGEDCIRNRIIEKKIGISEVASILQAIGYYPSEQDIEDIKNEIKYSKVLETGDYIEYIEFEDLIRIYLNHRPASDLTKSQIEKALLRTKEFEMPNVESDDDENNDIYYLGETDKQEYLENFKFKKSEEDESSIIKKILKNNNGSGTSSKSNSITSLDSKLNSKEDISNNNFTENELSSLSKDDINHEHSDTYNNNDDRNQIEDNNNSTKNDNSKSSQKEKKGNNRKGKKNAKKNILDDEDQTEARYKIMKINELERKEKVEKARERRNYIKNKDYGKFSKSALLSMLQQYGESLNADLFDKYIEELLRDNPSDYKQLAEFFTLDEFVDNVLNFEEELLPETLIEQLNNKRNNVDVNNNNNDNNNNDDDNDNNDNDNGWKDTEDDTEPYHIYTE